MTDQPAVIFENLSFAYGGRTVIEGGNLSIDVGEFACIVGPNGGGKTTLAKLMLGLLKPTTGSVRVFGKPPAQVRSRIGYMPQHIQLDPRFPVSVLDVVLMGRLGNGKLFGPYTADDRRAAELALREVELLDKRDRPFSELSGGEQRRLIIARAVACEPELLLLDEPTTNLDPRVERELYKVLDDLNRRMTVVVISHDMAFVSQFVQKVICVKRQIHVHPTSAIEGKMFAEIFGEDIRMIRHDRHSEH